MEMKIKDVVLKMYDRITYRGIKCSIARGHGAKSTRPLPCVEFLEETDHGWGEEALERNCPGYVPVGTIKRFWNIENDYETVEISNELYLQVTPIF